MNQEHVLTHVYRNLSELLNGYVSYPEVQDRMNEYIVRPGLGDNAGITGGLLLAEKVLEESKA